MTANLSRANAELTAWRRTWFESLFAGLEVGKSCVRYLAFDRGMAALKDELKQQSECWSHSQMQGCLG